MKKIKIDIIPYGDNALLVNFEQKIDPDINRLIHSLTDKIESLDIAGIISFIPAYCSLTVIYNHDIIPLKKLSQLILEISLGIQTRKIDLPQKKWIIPVCYTDGFELDMNNVSKITRLSHNEIIKVHTSVDYQVYMLGFLPGFAYLGKLPDLIYCKRKENPRTTIPSGSVGIAGNQTGVYPVDSPGGWQIIGKTPIPPFDIHRKNPFLFKNGEKVKFRSISKVEYYKIETGLLNGQFNMDSLNV